jgi:levansucrase
MNTKMRFLPLAGGVLLASCGAPGGPIATTASAIDYAPDQEFIEFRGDSIPLWNLEDAQSITPTTDTTFPYVLPSDPIFSREYVVWDAWPIRDRDGSVSQFGPWKVYVGMSAPRDSAAGGAGVIASYRYWYTKGDAEWEGGERVFPEGAAFGSRTWAGSTMYDPETERIHVFYTAVGNVPGGAEDVDPSVFPDDHPAANRPSTAQQLATARGDIRWDDERVWFEDWSEHEIIQSADGMIYQTQLEAEVDAVIYGFRDPWYFRDPNTGEDYLLFTANAAYAPGTHNGVVGVAHKVGDEWVLENPILQSAGISSQLERPHLVFTEEYTYLFFTTHGFTFQPEQLGPEGAYGFYVPGGDWRGDWEPLNQGGLIAGNPPSRPGLTYSYLVLPDFRLFSYQKNTPFSDFLAVPSPVVDLYVRGRRVGIEEVLTPLGPYGLPDEVPEGPASVGPSGDG